MDPLRENRVMITRRHFFGRTAAGIGGAALGSILNPGLLSASTGVAESARTGAGNPHFPAKAKRVIYLFMAGGPSQIDLLDYKPGLEKLHGTELPSSIRMGQRLTGMTSGQSSFPVVKSMFKFAQHGKSGTWISELLPHLSGIADAELKASLTKEIDRAKGVYKPEQLLAGIQILKGVAAELEAEKKSVFYVREGHLGWITAYVAEKVK